MTQIILTEAEESAMREIASIGIGNASTALEQILGSRINVKFPRIEMIELDQLTRIYPEQEVLIGVIMRFAGEISGKLFYLFKKDDIKKMMQVMMNAQGAVDLLESESVSTIKELGNILSASYINALSIFTSLHIVQSLPHLALDTPSSIFDLGSISDPRDMQLILLRSNIEISDINYSAEGSLIMELNAAEMQKLLKAVKEKYHM